MTTTLALLFAGFLLVVVVARYLPRKERCPECSSVRDPEHPLCPDCGWIYESDDEISTDEDDDYWHGGDEPPEASGEIDEVENWK